jgi:hypothetical protein
MSIECVSIPHAVSIYYRWGKYTLPSYDDVAEIAKKYGTAPVESIEKLFLTESECKRMAMHYLVRGA